MHTRSLHGCECLKGLSLPVRYGLEEFVVIVPKNKDNEVTSEAQAKLIMSSVAIAVNNTGW